MTTSESNETASMTFKFWLCKPLIKQSYCHIKHKTYFSFLSLWFFLLLALHTDGRSTIISVLNVANSWIFITEFITAYTGCPTRYRTRHFFNNSNTNEDIATKFEQEYIRCVRNEKECVCSAPNCCNTEQRSASQPACFLPDAPLCWSLCHLAKGA